MGFVEGTNVQFEVIQRSFAFIILSTVLAGGTFPGPVIRGFKGDQFLINVVNALTDDTMVRTTSVVRSPHSYSMAVNLTKEKLQQLALAWDIPEAVKLGRWCFLRHAVSHHPGSFIFIRISRGRPSGNILVSFARLWVK